jgi:hypothetical protein
VYVVLDTSWDENVITWNTRPNLGRMLGSVVVAGNASQTYDIDVTRYVQRERRVGHRSVSFALRNPTHTSAQVIFASREAGVELGPTLIIRRARD